MGTYYPPTYRAQKYHCPYCEVYAAQYWKNLYFGGTANVSSLEAATCAHCSEVTYWDDRTKSMIVPAVATAPGPHKDMPASYVQEFMEARDVFARSPRAAGALLRLCIQKLLISLGLPGRNINDDIAALVRDGLPAQVQKALDVCRVVGNNAVHPGELSLEDDPKVVGSMFELINYVVQDRITRPAEIDAMFNALPAGAREAIERRDGGA